MSAAAPAPAPDTTTTSRSWHARLRFGTGDRAAAALLLVFTILAILWANSPWGDTYEQFWETPVEIGVGDLVLSTTLHHVVNDAVMTLFFFVVGLEVKREFTLGELTERARAVVPVIAAVAGLIVPALIFVAIAWPSGEAHAWGVVISTDTAFLLGALAIIGPKFPARLRAFLLTLAVVDDIGALLAIAMFYNTGIQVVPLVVAAVLMIVIALIRFLPAWRGLAYAVFGIALWFAIAAAGVHPTLAGVAVALLIPVFPPRRTDVERSAELSQAFRESPNAAYAAALTRSLRDSLSINDRLQAAWGPYISFLVLPLFALANAGVHLDAETLGAALASPLTWGIVAGLVVGKFVGIAGSTLLIRMTGLGRLAPGLGMPRIAGGAALSGIGFTISLFIVTLAIADPETQDLARVGVLAASVIAFALGWAIFTIADRITPPQAVGKVLARPFDPSRDHFRGRPDAPHQIVEYGDFECPFCSRATGSIDAVIEHFGDDVCWVWRHLPLEAVHSHAKEAALAYEAAAMQGRFLDMSHIMFANQDALTADDLCRYAREIGLDVDRFIEDFRSPRALHRVEEDQVDAEMMDLHSTPTFFVGGRRHVGPWDSRTLIRALEASAQPRVEPSP
ncbi:Na+/H+ antiporter NhaA [Agromyces aurantiacus]|uniref:Na(+)/H(+) antiporter NhaA n=1 Tax=Agromyces aurantiacus TaxID=165814 RepID=A0ABV9R630_9MICO|nr:Na+/H+ antiporter NhaA [Agromyces aurantiacus]MBM7503621.1 Na+/H+ antiporter NhaA [Agromyces aurantiacus]